MVGPRVAVRRLVRLCTRRFRLLLRHRAPCSFHSLRHDFGTHAARRGAAIEAIREMMGHADLSSTARYLRASGNDKRRAIALLTGQLGGPAEGVAVTNLRKSP